MLPYGRRLIQKLRSENILTFLFVGLGTFTFISY